MDAKIEGTVRLYVEVGIDGLAHNVRVIKGLGFGLDESAIEAVRKWQFAPARRDGRRVGIPTTVEVQFRLSDSLPVRIYPHFLMPSAQIPAAK
jgi:TonB family protein